jgi:hypothetical protein
VAHIFACERAEFRIRSELSARALAGRKTNARCRIESGAMARHAVELKGGGAERFEIRRTLGAGGLGVVYEAYDRERDARVALKTLKRASPEAITRLKREFRALEDLQHPNLVTLHELFEEHGEWFFTMELVEGRDFLSYVRRLAAENENGPAFDERRIRQCLTQLTSGLLALHAIGKVHRDVKPSNVLVTPEGRAVLLDFGLVADVDRDPDWTAAKAVGTAVYMAPEQAAGRPVGPAADWYAVGAMLYEALTGSPPFLGTTWQVLVEKQQEEPRAPSELVRAVPGDLSALCLELLRIEPARRPVGTQVMERLLTRASHPESESDPPSLELGLDAFPSVQRTGVTQQRAALFMGREAELRMLEEALLDTQRGEQVTVYVRGESGIGKSALIRAFASTLSEREVVVLRGRCYEREAVAYKAVDGVLENLAEVLRALPAAEAAALMPRRASLLLRAFPALTRVPAFANTSREPALDPQEMRTRLFAAFRELFVRLSVRHSVVIAIDDLQWSDAESLALLSELLRAPEAPPLLFIASWRSTHSEENAGVDIDALPRNARWLDLARLSPEHATSLARALLGMAGADLARASEVAQAADGHPMFIDELARFTSLEPVTKHVARLEDALWGRIERLEPSVRRLVEVYAMASTPLAPVAAARAARLSPGEFARHLSALRVMRLVRTSATRSGETAEPYHDSVRRAVRVRLKKAQERSLHADIARALRVTGHGNLEQLATHYEAAEEHEQALHFLERAAEQADHALAFGYAAELYGRALALMPEGHEGKKALLIKRGDALANAGCGHEAAELYSQAAEGAEAREALELARRAAHQLLITGHMEAGMRRLEEVLKSDGIVLPKTPTRALFTVLARRIQLKLRGLEFKRLDESQVTPQQRDRADVCWRAGLSLGMADPIRGQALSLRAVAEAFKVGDPYRVARAISVQAGYLAISGRAAEKDVDRILERAEALAREADSPHALGVMLGAKCQARFLVARFRSAAECSSEAEQVLRERCVGVHWELNIVRLWGMRSLLLLGDFRQVSARLPGILEECRQRRDLYGEVSLRASVYASSLLAKDAVSEALADLAHARERWSPAGFHTQHYYLLSSLAQIELYAGRHAEAQAVTDELRAGVERSLLKRVQSVRVILYSLCGRVALARAEGESCLRKVEGFARTLRRERASWASAHADLLMAGVEHARARDQAALKFLKAAVTTYEAEDMRLQAACARHQLGVLLGGDEGRVHREEAANYLSQQRIQNPERMIAQVTPGFRPK